MSARLGPCGCPNASRAFSKALFGDVIVVGPQKGRQHSLGGVLVGQKKRIEQPMVHVLDKDM